MPEQQKLGQVLELCIETLKLPAHERMVFLSKACAGDFRLRASVESVLVALKDAQQFMDVSALGADRLEDLVGDTLGEYRLLEFLGESALGAVFRAQHIDDETAPDYAVRVLRGHLLARELIERFSDEVKNVRLARHPNLASLVDGGTSANGAPYLVYEFIEGTRIDEYCDRCRIDVAGRLDLLRSVCSGVHLAHQHLVAGSGITPSNILVTESGVPKLLDFASVCLLTARWPGAAQTPAFAPPRAAAADYAAPELLLESHVLTGGDVYALGVVATHLLTGERPYRLPSRDPEVIARTLRNATDVPPSACVQANTDWALAKAIAHRRGTSPPQLVAALEGQVDAIVLHAMAFDESRRYESAAAMGQDIARYLQGDPVAAFHEAAQDHPQRRLNRRRVTLAAIVGATVLLTIAAVRAL